MKLTTCKNLVYFNSSIFDLEDGQGHVYHGKLISEDNYSFRVTFSVKF